MSDNINNGLVSAACDSDCSTCEGCDNPVSSIDPENPTVTLTLDDDTEIVCAILNVFNVEEKEYISLLPLDENGENSSGEVYLYRYIKNAAGDPELDNIEDDDEYTAAANTFNALMEQINIQEDAENPLEGIVSKEE